MVPAVYDRAIFVVHASLCFVSNDVDLSAFRDTGRVISEFYSNKIRVNVSEPPIRAVRFPVILTRQSRLMAVVG